MESRKLQIVVPGAAFGRLVVEKSLGFVWLAGVKQHLWRCWCECGGRNDVQDRLLKSSQVRSCGCLRGRRRNAQGQLCTQPQKKPAQGLQLPIRSDGSWYWRGRWRPGKR